MTDENAAETRKIPPAELVELHLDDRGVDFKMRHPIVPIMAEHLAAAFKDAGGVNYVSFEIDTAELGPLLLTMQRRWGETPERQAARYRAALHAIASGDGDARMIAQGEIDHVGR